MASAVAPHEPTWKTHPEAFQLVCDGIAEIVNTVPMLQNLSERMLKETGTELLNWTDRLTVDVPPTELMDCGFELSVARGQDCYKHPRAQLPTVVKDCGKKMLAIKVESAVDFLETHGMDSRHQILGAPGSQLRKCCVHCDSESEVWIVERHGSVRWDVPEVSAQQLERAVWHFERFRLRRRDFDSDAMGFEHARTMISEAIQDIGRDYTADLFFAAERAYWQNRNDAGRIQRMRQGRLGLGWANHDHHTYRSSRASFADLIRTLELLGMECRERFYAGREAGWGAQVMEQPACGVVVFADVDLGAEEISQDFAHHPMPKRSTLGTVGLWCALHGEAFLQAGLHHLECEFEFDAAREQLEQQGVASMNPFTDLHHLRQSFTVGQRWSVCPQRAQRAVEAGWITAEQAEKFVREGTLGSHLEILQRREGYKGFNPKGISDIITETDPRNAAH
jgi:hypothetical protein